MKIKTKDFEFEGEYPTCSCRGLIVPIFKHRTHIQILVWECTKCDKIFDVEPDF